MKSTIGDDGHVCTSVTVYGLGDGLGERNLVHGDRLDGVSVQGRAGSSGVGARLDWTTWVDGGALRSAIPVSGE